MGFASWWFAFVVTVVVAAGPVEVLAEAGVAGVRERCENGVRREVLVTAELVVAEDLREATLPAGDGGLFASCLLLESAGGWSEEGPSLTVTSVVSLETAGAAFDFLFQSQLPMEAAVVEAVLVALDGGAFLD